MNPKYVKIPFRARFRESMLSGKKTYTSRPQSMGSPGQMFVAFGARFCLTKVESVKLSYICEELYEEEGFSSSEKFIEAWESIYPYKGYTPFQTVYLHKFFLVPPSYPKREGDPPINALDKEVIGVEDRVIAVPVGSHSSGSCGESECWCNPPKLTVVSEETKPKRKRSRKKKNE